MATHTLHKHKKPSEVRKIKQGLKGPLARVKNISPRVNAEMPWANDPPTDLGPEIASGQRDAPLTLARNAQPNQSLRNRAAGKYGTANPTLNQQGIVETEQQLWDAKQGGMGGLADELTQSRERRGQALTGDFPLDTPHETLKAFGVKRDLFPGGLKNKLKEGGHDYGANYTSGGPAFVKQTSTRPDESKDALEARRKVIDYMRTEKAGGRTGLGFNQARTEMQVEAAAKAHREHVTKNNALMLDKTEAEIDRADEISRWHIAEATRLGNDPRASVMMLLAGDKDQVEQGVNLAKALLANELGQDALKASQFEAFTLRFKEILARNAKFDLQKKQTLDKLALIKPGEDWNGKIVPENAEALAVWKVKTKAEIEARHIKDMQDSRLEQQEIAKWMQGLMNPPKPTLKKGPPVPK